jgi:hypothetical protein
MNNALIYSVRFLPKLGLPQVILDNISKLRTVPAAYRPNRPVKQKFISKIENWRLTVLVDFVRKVRETDDPQYDQIFMILNKISSKTMDELSAEALSIVKERDEQFRLRVTTLIFDKAIKGSAYAGLMSDIAQKMAVEILK